MREWSLESREFGVLATQILRERGELRFRASGSSMCPIIHDGDLIHVRSIRGAEVRVGDVVLCFVDGRRLLAHRVVKVIRDRARTVVCTRGDARAVSDGPVPAEQVLGRVVFLERQGRGIALDRGPMRWLGWAWVWCSPVIRWLWSVFAACKHKLCQALT